SDALATLRVDHANRLRVGVAIGRPLAVRAEAELPEETARERTRGLAGRKVQHPQSLVATADEPLAVRAVGEPPGIAGVARDGRGHRGGLEISDFDGTAPGLVLKRPPPVSPGEGLAVGAESDGVYPVTAGQGADQFARPRVEEGDHVRVRDRQELALAV